LVYTFEEADELLFPESLTKDEILDIVKKYIADNPDKKWIRGHEIRILSMVVFDLNSYWNCF